MSSNGTTTGIGGDTVRSPFGEAHYLALKRAPATLGNSQRADFLTGKPNVWDTLYRHLDALILNGATQEQYDAVCHAAHLGMLALYPKRAGEPTHDVETALSLDEAAEGFEGPAEIAAATHPRDPSRLMTLIERMTASLSVKQLAIRVLHREFRRATGRAA